MFIEKGWVHDGIDYSFTPLHEEDNGEEEDMEEEDEEDYDDFQEGKHATFYSVSLRARPCVLVQCLA